MDLCTARIRYTTAAQGRMLVRYLDWRDELPLPGHDWSKAEPLGHKSCPTLPEGQAFDIVIGSDLIYEVFLPSLPTAELKTVI